MRWLWPEDQKLEREKAMKIALKWRRRNMSFIDRQIDKFITHIRRTRTPMLVDGDSPQEPIYHRFFVLPRNGWLDIYLHNFLRDDAQDPHDHRMMNISCPLTDFYYEDTFDRQPKLGGPYPGITRRVVKMRRLRFRLPRTPHRVVLRKDHQGKPIPMWSIFIGFPKFREWGFWTKHNPEQKPGADRALWVWWEIYDEERTRHYRESLKT